MSKGKLRLTSRWSVSYAIGCNLLRRGYGPCCSTSSRARTSLTVSSSGQQADDTKRSHMAASKVVHRCVKAGAQGGRALAPASSLCRRIMPRDGQTTICASRLGVVHIMPATRCANKLHAECCAIKRCGALLTRAAIWTHYAVCRTAGVRGRPHLHAKRALTSVLREAGARPDVERAAPALSRLVADGPGGAPRVLEAILDTAAPLPRKEKLTLCSPDATRYSAGPRPCSRAWDEKMRRYAPTSGVAVRPVCVESYGRLDDRRCDALREFSAELASWTSAYSLGAAGDAVALRGVGVLCPRGWLPDGLRRVRKCDA